MATGTIVYIDGLNLYHGMLKDSTDQWLDLGKYFTMLRQGEVINKIHYYPCKLAGPQHLPQKTYRTAIDAYYPAPNSLVKMSAHGYRHISGLVGATHIKVQGAKAIIPVELATQMIDDAAKNRCDTLVLVSGASEFIPLFQMLKDHYPTKRRILYVPNVVSPKFPVGYPDRSATILRSLADVQANLPPTPMAQCHFTDPLTDSNGNVLTDPKNNNQPIRKPPTW